MLIPSQYFLHLGLILRPQSLKTQVPLSNCWINCKSSIVFFLNRLLTSCVGKNTVILFLQILISELLLTIFWCYWFKANFIFAGKAVWVANISFSHSIFWSWDPLFPIVSYYDVPYDLQGYFVFISSNVIPSPVSFATRRS